MSLTTYLKPAVVIFAGAYLLAACASDPSPWSQSSSPWGDKNGQTEEVAAEEVAPAAEQTEFVEPVPEPVEAVAAEPIAPEVVMAEPVMAETPVTHSTAAGGDLASQPPGYFAVQVCASRSMKQLAGFAKRHNLSDQWTAQTTVKGETWFVLLEGVYATRAEAQDAKMRVSSQVDTRPWIRTMSSLQAAMQ
jgi:DamX protein